MQRALLRGKCIGNWQWLLTTAVVILQFPSAARVHGYPFRCHVDVNMYVFVVSKDGNTVSRDESICIFTVNCLIFHESRPILSHSGNSVFRHTSAYP
jgi:hypothetical protein